MFQYPKGQIYTSHERTKHTYKAVSIPKGSNLYEQDRKENFYWQNSFQYPKGQIYTAKISRKNGHLLGSIIFLISLKFAKNTQLFYAKSPKFRTFRKLKFSFNFLFLI